MWVRPSFSNTSMRSRRDRCTNEVVRPVRRARQTVAFALVLVALLAAAGTQRLDAQASAAGETAPALRGGDRWADSVRRLLDLATYSGKATDFAAARVAVDRALQAFPQHGYLLHYRGTLHWREAQMALARGDDDAAEAGFTRAIEILQASVIDAPIPESYAIIASAHGSLAGSGVIAGMRHGPKATEAMERARSLAPRNPRVLLLAAISAHFTPKAFGGGEEKARRLMAEALAAFPADAPAPPAPAWGHAEALAWHGQWEAEAGRTADARAAYERALALVPNYQWVSQVLLPQLARAR